MPITVLSVKKRARMGKELAAEMRKFLKEHGELNRSFSIQEDTPLSVIWYALMDLYGPCWDTEMQPEDYNEVMRWDMPRVYLRDDPVYGW